jgi:hypothetical protein
MVLDWVHGTIRGNDLGKKRKIKISRHCSLSIDSLTYLQDKLASKESENTRLMEENERLSEQVLVPLYSTVTSTVPFRHLSIPSLNL